MGAAVSWAKLDDQFPDHPKIEAAGPEAAWLYVCGICYCARYLTDGEIPKSRVARLTAFRNNDKLALRLRDAGLWIDAGNVWLVHDYLGWNPSREHVEAQRAKERQKKATGRARQGRDERGRITGVPGGVPGGHTGGIPPVPSPSPSPSEDEREMYVEDRFTQVPGDDDTAELIHLAARLGAAVQ